MFGLQSKKLYNFNFLDSKTLIFAAGISYQIYNYETKERKVFFCRDGGGVGSIAIDPERRFFAVAEKGEQPNIYIYEFPSLRLYRVMRGGTERSYSNITFSEDGTLLASVGSHPDYNICIWDWKNEVLVLKSKAFSQEVFRVAFSKYTNQILSTSGLAHLRFWKIAGTFTGLKLKGETGKFGQVELSDITGFTVFPDNKVLCGAENGALLLWEGNLIKVVIHRTQESKCHNGTIYVVERHGDQIITAGADGYIRRWNFELIDNLEADDYMKNYIEPEEEVQLFSNFDAPTSEPRRPCEILDIKFYIDFWMVHDGHGNIFKYFPEEKRQENTFKTNSGKLNGLAISHSENACATIGEDGAVRLWDYVKKKEFYYKKFEDAGTCIDWLILTMKHTDRYIATGYASGIMRILYLSAEGVKLIQVYKVHNNPVKKLSFSPSGEHLVVLSEKSELFFFKVTQKSAKLEVIPYCYYPYKRKIGDFCWSNNSEYILTNTNEGVVSEIEVPHFEDIDTTETFLIESLQEKTYTIKMMLSQKPKKDLTNKFDMLFNDKIEEIEVEWDPAPISSVMYLSEDEGTFLCSVEGLFAGKLYICKFGEERPLNAIECSKDRIVLMQMSSDNKYVFLGSEFGEINIRPLEYMDLSMSIRAHDQDDGYITGIALNLDKECVISSSWDGTLNTQKMDYSFLAKVVQLRQDMKAQKELGPVSEVAEEGEEEEDDEEKDPDKEKPEGEDEEWDSSEEEEIDTIVWSEVVFPSLEVGIDDRFFEDEPPLQEAEDIINHNVYSIQEEKLKAEEDKRKELAEVRKSKMRSEIEELRQKLSQVRSDNESYELFFRIEEENFTLDQEYHQMLVSKVEDMKEEATKDMAWDIAKYKLMTKKIKDFYLEELEVDRFSVCGFKRNIIVTTFRVKKPTPYFIEKQRETEEITRNQDLHGNDDENDDDAHDAEEGIGENDGIWSLKDIKGMNKDIYLKEKKNQLKASLTEKNSEEKFTRERMKEEKKKRVQIRKQLADKKPKQENIKDNPEIRKAKDNMGDYKLKCDPNYEVSIDQRMNVVKQRKMIYMVEEFVYNVKMDFNKSLIEMREQRAELFQKIKATKTRIIEINKELEDDESLMVPVYNEPNDEIEHPERVYEVTEEEVKELAKEKEEEQKRAKKGRFGVMESAANNQEAAAKDANGSEVANQHDRSEITYKIRKTITNRVTSLQEEENKIKKIRLESERRILSEKIEDQLNIFDEDLEMLSTSKTQLEFEIKLAEMKVITFYQELIILEAYEEKDNRFLQELAEQKSEHHDLCEKKSKLVLESTKEAETQKQKLMKLKEAEATYNEQIGKEKEANSKLYEAYKEYKQSHEDKPTEDGEDDHLDEHFDEAEDEIHKKYGVDIKEFITSTQSDKKSVILKNRYTAEKELEQCKMNLANITAQDEKLTEKIEMLKKKLSRTRTNIKELQRDKLRDVSELYVSFFLRLDQVKNLNSEEIIEEDNTRSQKNYLPPTLNTSILFTDKELDKLNSNREALISDTSK